MIEKKEYIKLNNSFKPLYTYNYTNRGTGFYSNYNNMILTMAYCLSKHVKYRLYTKGYKLFKGKGWDAVFQPLLPETTSVFHKYFNGKIDYCGEMNFKRRLIQFMQYSYEIITGRFLTYSCFLYCRTFVFYTKHFIIKELGFEGGLRELCSELIDMTYCFNEEYKNKISDMISTIELPTNYIGMHIRRGDKDTEVDLYDTDIYFELAEKLSDCRNVFILTDDYRVIELVKEKYPSWNVSTLTFPYERGFVLKSSTADADRADKELVKVFASLEVISKALHFIGTVSTNPGLFLGMRMDPSKVHYIDSEDWIIT